MTVLSVNVNKIALLRNSRGRDFPSVVGFSEQLIDLGVKGITVHPRPDERHVTRRDVYALSEMLRDKPQVEFNIEGYPSEDFIKMVLEVCPDQCTLVPDSPGQLTSDHGWNIPENQFVLQQVLSELREGGVRSSLFLDPDPEMVGHVTRVAADRIELYTENFANHHAGPAAGGSFRALSCGGPKGGSTWYRDQCRARSGLTESGKVFADPQYS